MTLQAAVKNPMGPIKASQSLSKCPQSLLFGVYPAMFCLVSSTHRYRDLPERMRANAWQPVQAVVWRGGSKRLLFVLLLSQFKSPIVLLLRFAAGLSMFLGEHTDALIIFFIVFVSGLLGFWQERGAANAVAKLLAVVQTKTNVRATGKHRKSRWTTSFQATSSCSARAMSFPATAWYWNPTS